MVASPHADRDRVMCAITVGADGHPLRPLEQEALEARLEQERVRRRLRLGGGRGLGAVGSYRPVSDVLIPHHPSLDPYDETRHQC